MGTKNLVQHVSALGLLAVCAATFGVGTASATDFGVPKASIRYDDLNLSTAKGATTLYQRIEKASYVACRNYDRDEHDNADPLSLRACRRKVIAAAVTKIGRPALYAEYNARNAVPLPSPIVTAGRGK